MDPFRIDSITSIKYYLPYLFQVAKDYFCYKAKVRNELVIYDQDPDPGVQLFGIIKLHNYHKTLDGSEVTGLSDNLSKRAKKEVDKYKLYLSEVWNIKEALNLSGHDLLILMSTLDKYFTHMTNEICY